MIDEFVGHIDTRPLISNVRSPCCFIILKRHYPALHQENHLQTVIVASLIKDLLKEQLLAGQRQVSETNFASG